jgi:hypothetical protein
VLAPGQSETVEVFARELWNETGLYLEAGEYSFTAAGEWLDGDIAAGPAGATGLRRFNPFAEKGRLVGTLSGQVEKLFQSVTGNNAGFVGTRRVEDQPWMSLAGVVANDAVPVKGAFTVHEHIAIGAGTHYDVTRSGYLYVFANDAWGFYGNNQGSVRLTVKRMPARGRASRPRRAHPRVPAR